MRTTEIGTRTVLSLFTFFVLLPAPTAAQNREQTLQAVAKLQGSERETKVREGREKKRTSSGIRAQPQMIL